MDLAALIKQHAWELGFDDVGIVRATPLPEEREQLRHWLDLGFAGTMSWMERTHAKRTDPREHMPEVQSIVCVALNYYTGHTIEDRRGHGKISRYAWGDDYHDVLGRKLRQLLDWIRTMEPNCRGKIAVDSSPVMDKQHASRAGLGWIGKHSNLIHPSLGSWIFLGELLLNLELQCDPIQVPDHCGTCTLCIDACPTGAIVEPYVVDSRKCISYQTIELRSETLEVDTDGWVYGCDVCQDVCPWNQSATPTREAAFQPRADLLHPELDWLVAMSEDEFQAVAKGSPIRRAKHRGLVRNAGHVKASQQRSEHA